MLDQRGRCIATALLLAMLAAAARVMADLPPGKLLAVHFDAAGAPDGWAPAWLALLVIPALSLGMLALFALLPKIDPRGENLLRSTTAVQTTILAVMGVMTVVQLLVAAHALDIPAPVAPVVATAVGLLFVLIGNVMGKLRWNYTVGIRTPWTIADQRVWDRTHRFAGRLFVAAGAAMAAGAWLSALRGHESTLIAAGTVLVAALPVLRSYQLSKEPPRADA